MPVQKRPRPKSSSDSPAPSLARGRPKAGTGAAISAAILAAAAEVFLADGFEAASIEAIATRAGVTKVTLYKRFPDKRSLLRAVLQERRPHWIPPPPTDPALDRRLQYYAVNMLTRAISPEIRAFHRLATNAWPAPEDMPAREEVLGYNDMVRCLEQEIRDGSETLGVSEADAGAVAAALMAMLSGWFDHRAAPPGVDAGEAAEFARKAVALLIHGKAAW